MSKKHINYLLNKYPSHRRAKGEKWSKESLKKEKQMYRTSERLNLFESINNQHLRLKGTSKEQVQYYISHIEFSPRLSEEQTIIMLMLYVKLKEGRRYQQYDYILPKYGLTHASFINFLVNRFVPLFKAPNEK